MKTHFSTSSTGLMARVILLLTVLLTGVACAHKKPAQYTEVREESWHFQANPETRLALGTVNGAIRIQAHDGPGIDIKATIRAKNREDLERLFVEVKQDSNRISLQRKSRKKGWFNRDSVDGKIDFVVFAPASVWLDEIDTVNGGLTIIGNTQAAVVNAVNSQIDLRQMAGSVSVDVVNGNVAVQMQRLGQGQKVEIDSVNGDIEIALPADASARLKINTVNGDTEFQGFDATTHHGLIGREVNATIGSGEAILSLDTVNGDMVISKQ